MPDTREPALNIGELYRQTAAQLRQGGIDEAQLEAEVILRTVFGLTRVEMHLADRQVASGQLAAIAGMVARRLTREPLAYILGEREFWSLPFAVSPAVLIPRPETELLVEEVLARIANPATYSGTILDLGSGSGVIPVVLARELPLAQLVGIDLSSAALAVAAANARRHGVAERITWLQGDWFAPLAPGSRFSFMVSNPPYVAELSRPTLQPELEHEPSGALFAGPDGLADLRRIIAGGPAYLAPGGWLIMEIGYDQGRAVTDLLAAQPELTTSEIVRDYAGHDRLAVARKNELVAPAAEAEGLSHG